MVMHDDPPSKSSMPAQPSPSRNTSAARAIAALVTRLLAHYWTADDNEVARKLQIAGWIEDLVEFGPTLVNEALGDWRRTESHRPTIAQIRARCIGLQSEAAERRLRIEDHRAPWPGWLSQNWGSYGQLERRDAIATQEARYLRGEVFRGKPVHWIADLSLEQLRQRFPDAPDEVITRAFDLISEINQRRAAYPQLKEA